MRIILKKHVLNFSEIFFASQQTVLPSQSSVVSVVYLYISRYRSMANHNIFTVFHLCRPSFHGISYRVYLTPRLTILFDGLPSFVLSFLKHFRRFFSVRHSPNVTSLSLCFPCDDPLPHANEEEGGQRTPLILFGQPVDSWRNVRRSRFWRYLQQSLLKGIYSSRTFYQAVSWCYRPLISSSPLRVRVFSTSLRQHLWDCCSPLLLQPSFPSKMRNLSSVLTP